jgi:hypothetical protein
MDNLQIAVPDHSTNIIIHIRHDNFNGHTALDEKRTTIIQALAKVTERRWGSGLLASLEESERL